MKYKYNEREYAKVIKNGGFQSKYRKYELTILVKYLKELGKTKKETEVEIYDFCKKHIEGFNAVRFYKLIDTSIKNGRKKDNPLVVVESIPILKKELELIDSKDIDIEYKKLLLSLLVKKKISHEIFKIQNGNDVELSAYFNGTNKTYREVFNMANIDEKGYKINEMIGFLVKNKIIESIIKGDIILSYMFDIYDTYCKAKQIINKSTGEVVEQEYKYIDYNFNEEDVHMTLNNFESIGYVFDLYKGDNKIKTCESKNCSNLIKAKSNRKKYCSSCQREIREQQNREKSLKYYHKTKNFTN